MLFWTRTRAWKDPQLFSVKFDLDMGPGPADAKFLDLNRIRVGFGYGRTRRSLLPVHIVSSDRESGCGEGSNAPHPNNRKFSFTVSKKAKIF